jgi:hypothetical protein
MCFASSGFVYDFAFLLAGGPFEVLPLCAVSSLASLIYLRMNGGGYYELRESAKPRIELREILGGRTWASRRRPARPRAMAWNGAGGWLIVSIGVEIWFCVLPPAFRRSW